MLEELTIRDFAIIDRLSLRFGPGFNLLSGETGAGKSILIGALSFIMGAKADTGIIRSGCEEAMVSATLDLDGREEALAWLAERGIEAEDGVAILRRSLRSNARGAAYIQNVPVVRQDLADFAALIAELHGQRDTQALLKRERQRQILDRYAGLDEALSAYGVRYASLSEKKKLLESMSLSEQERNRELELLRYAVEEIDAAAPKPGEDEALHDEELLLSQREKLYAAVESVKSLVAEPDAALSKLRKARTQLEAAAAIDKRLAEQGRRLDELYYELEDLSAQLGSYGVGDFDPGRLEAVVERLAELQKLKRKYGPSLAEVLEHRRDADERAARLERWADDRSGLEAEVAALEAEVYALAEGLSAERAKAGAALEAACMAVLHTLGMPGARFAVRLERKPLADGKLVVGPYGYDEPEFMVSANKGEPLKSVTQVASGGELSRIMLALKTVLAGADEVPTLVFDEVDAGIGGEVALAVGEHLSELATRKQVFCITHLASIAVRADNHYKVEKYVESERTFTRVVKLDGERRVREIARMLSGDAEGRASVGHAEELLAKYGRPRD